MKPIQLQINPREPNIDRFLEILAVGKRFNIYFKWYIGNLPSLYSDIVLYITGFHSMKAWEFNHDFYLEYPLDRPVEKCFRKSEPIEDILIRISNAKEIEDLTLDTASLAMLKHAATKLPISVDGIQQVIYMAYVIACLDLSGKIEAHHIAEAIQYTKNTQL